MASIVERLLRVTLALIKNNKTDTDAENGKNCNHVVEKKFQNVIVREINTIKSKLDWTERKNLVAVISSFEMGLSFVYQLFNKTTSGQQQPLNAKLGALEGLEAEIIVTVDDRLKKLDLTELDDCTEQLLCKSKSSFKAAREGATRIFSNEALSISDRILALKFSVMAVVLECMDSLDDAFEACKWYLEELHAIPAVQETFNLQVSGGLNKGEQELVELITDVCLVNHVIFNVTQIVSEESCCLFPWPRVDIGEEKIDPLRDERVVKSLRKQSFGYCDRTWSFGQEGRPGTNLRGPFDVTANSIGLFIVADCDSRDLKVFNSSGKYLFSFYPPNIDKNTERFIPISVATDQYDNVFVLARIKAHYGSAEWHGVYVFNNNFKVDHKFILREGFRGWTLAASEDNKLFVLGGYQKQPQVYVYDTDGNFIQSSGEGLLTGACDVTVAKNGCVMVLENRNHAVHVFSSNGDELQQFKLRGSVYPVGCITFNHTSEQIIIASKNRLTRRGQLEMYTKHGEFFRAIQIDTEKDVYLLGATAAVDGCIAVVNWSQDKVNIIQPT